MTFNPQPSTKDMRGPHSHTYSDMQEGSERDTKGHINVTFTRQMYGNVLLHPRIGMPPTHSLKSQFNFSLLEELLQNVFVLRIPSDTIKRSRPKDTDQEFGPSEMERVSL